MAHGASGVIADECVAVKRLAVQIAQLHIAVHRLSLAAEDDPNGELMLVVFLIVEREQNALPFVDAAETAIHPRAVVELHAASRRLDIGIAFAFNLLDDGGQLARLILFLFLFLILRLILRFAGFFRRADVFFALRFFLPLGLLRRGLGLRLGLLRLGLRLRLRLRFGFRFGFRLRLRLDIHRLAADHLLLRAQLFRAVRLLFLALRVGMAGADRQFGVHHQHGGNQHGSGVSLLHGGRSLSLIAHFDAFSHTSNVALCRFMSFLGTKSISLWYTKNT